MKFIAGHGGPRTLRILSEKDYTVANRGHSTSCSIWSHATDPLGYGRLIVGNERTLAHVAMWEQTHGQSQMDWNSTIYADGLPAFAPIILRQSPTPRIFDGAKELSSARDTCGGLPIARHWTFPSPDRADDRDRQDDSWICVEW